MRLDLVVSGKVVSGVVRLGILLRLRQGSVGQGMLRSGMVRFGVIILGGDMVKGFMMILPSWYSTLEKKLKEIVKDFAIDNDIDLTFVEDSISIADSIDNICMAFVRISSQVGDKYGRSKR